MFTASNSPINCGFFKSREGSLWCDTRHDGIELFSDSMLEEHGCSDLPHLPRNLTRGVFPLGTMRGDVGQVLFSVRRLLLQQCCFQQPLRYQIGIATVGRRRVCVVVNCESKMSSSGSAWRLHDVFSWSEQFDD